MKLQFQKWDVFAIAIVVVIAAIILFLFLPNGESSAAYAEIYQDGKLVKTVSLSVDQEFSITGKYTNTITICDGKIAVTQSDCPGEDCVSCGFADSAGRSIVCLPNGLEIRVIAGENDVDFVVG